MVYKQEIWDEAKENADSERNKSVWKIILRSA